MSLRMFFTSLATKMCLPTCTQYIVGDNRKSYNVDIIKIKSQKSVYYLHSFCWHSFHHPCYYYRLIIFIWNKFFDYYAVSSHYTFVNFVMRLKLSLVVILNIYHPTFLIVFECSSDCISTSGSSATGTLNIMSCYRYLSYVECVHSRIHDCRC